jgi:DNA-binding response OmpR family regulator
MSKYHLLVVEDEPDQVITLTRTLHALGYQTTVAHDYDSASAAMRQTIRFDLVLLDLRLGKPVEPVRDGLAVCQMIRARPNPPPIIMLTVLGNEADVVKGLDLGATDYITKPYSNDILRARIRAVLRTVIEVGEARVEEIQQPQLLIIEERLQIDRGKRKVSKDGNGVKLTPLEFKVLLYLADRPGVPVGPEELRDKVWDTEYVELSTVYRHISELRRKIEDDPRDPYYILSEYGYGYKFRER